MGLTFSFQARALALLFCTVNVLSAPENASERLAMATNQIVAIASRISSECLTNVDSLEAWQGQRPIYRQQLREMLGLDPLPKRSALNAKVTRRHDRAEYIIENIVFESLPGLYVTGNLYLPKDMQGRIPTVLYLCGHLADPFGGKVPYQDRAMWYASHGFICFILDTLEYGEVAGIHHGTHNLNMWNWLSLGYTPAGVEVWNAMRALDYLETRPEVDSKRIGLTGISGGGAMTWYTAALDDRIAVAAPVCSTYTFGTQAAHWLASGQCDCIYFPNRHRWDFPIVGALIAPRPLLIMSGRRDSIFPPDGYHAVFQRAKRIYDFYGTQEVPHVREVDDDVEHSDAPLFQREAHQWMQQWLKGDQTALLMATNPPSREVGTTLACLSKIPADAINFRIQNEFVSLPALKKPSSREALAERKLALVSQLKSKVFSWFPTDRIPFETTALARGGGGWVTHYCEYREVSFNSETGARVRAQILTPKNKNASTPLLIYVKRAGDSLYSADFDELLPLLNRFQVIVLYPRFTEQPLTPTEYTDIERTSAWIGRTIAGMQVWDILRTIQWAIDDEKLSPTALALYGKGDMGILSLYAGLFDDHVKTVIFNDAPGSHWEHPALLNVLRITDIAEVAAAFAPRELISLTDYAKSFDYTHDIYKLAGARDKMKRAGSLPEALEVWRIESRK